MTTIRTPHADSLLHNSTTRRCRLVASAEARGRQQEPRRRCSAATSVHMRPLALHTCVCCSFWHLGIGAVVEMDKT
eukprot:2346749-Pleurochrysis_carterae.AAC.2